MLAGGEEGGGVDDLILHVMILRQAQGGVAMAPAKNWGRGGGKMGCVELAWKILLIPSAFLLHI